MHMATANMARVSNAPTLSGSTDGSRRPTDDLLEDILSAVSRTARIAGASGLMGPPKGWSRDDASFSQSHPLMRSASSDTPMTLCTETAPAFVCAVRGGHETGPGTGAGSDPPAELLSGLFGEGATTSGRTLYERTEIFSDRMDVQEPHRSRCFDVDQSCESVWPFPDRRGVGGATLFGGSSFAYAETSDEDEDNDSVGMATPAFARAGPSPLRGGTRRPFSAASGESGATIATTSTYDRRRLLRESDGSCQMLGRRNNASRSLLARRGATTPVVSRAKSLSAIETAERRRCATPVRSHSACTHCGNPTLVRMTKGETSCTSCGAASAVEMVSRDRNGQGERDEDLTVRGDARADFGGPVVPPKTVEERRNAISHSLGIDERTRVPESMRVSQDLATRAAANEALAGARATDGVSRAIELRGNALQRSTDKLIESHDLTLNEEMVVRVKNATAALWSRIATHHSVCTSRPGSCCHRDLSGCPNDLLALISLLMCIEDTERLVVPGTSEDERCGGVRSLLVTASSVKQLISTLARGSETNRSRSLHVARRLMNDDASVESPCTPADGAPSDAERQSSRVSGAHASLSGGASLPISIPAGRMGSASFRSVARRSTESGDDESSVASSTHGREPKMSVECTKLHIKQELSRMQLRVHITTGMRTRSMKLLGSDRFLEAIAPGGSLSEFRPGNIAGALLYSVVLLSPTAGHGSAASTASTESDESADSPVPRMRMPGTFVSASHEPTTDPNGANHANYPVSGAAVTTIPGSPLVAARNGALSSGGTNVGGSVSRPRRRTREHIGPYMSGMRPGDFRILAGIVGQIVGQIALDDE